jgi:hypothetical protein
MFAQIVKAKVVQISMMRKKNAKWYKVKVVQTNMLYFLNMSFFLANPISYRNFSVHKHSRRRGGNML